MPFSPTCPSCGGPWQERAALIGVRRRDWDSLAFRCLECGVGYSNATDPAARVLIVRAVDQAVPRQVHVNLETALDQAFNVRNRPSKRNAFCSFNSEDAATWTVFSGLAGLRQLDRVAALIAPDHSPSSRIDLLVWGVPVASADTLGIAEHLKTVSDAVGERALSRTEPDVILVTDTLVSFVEAKTGSTNDVNTEAAGWPLYLADRNRFRTPVEEVRWLGLYELVRNWVIGNRLADALGRDFRLVNLGPVGLASDVDRLRRVLVITAHRDIAHLRWSALLDGAGTLPSWLTGFVRDRHLHRL